jgi:hypothetical protein
MDAELVERLEKAVEALTGATNDFATSMKGLSDESKDLARLFGQSSGEMKNWAASTDDAAKKAAGLFGIIQDEDSTMIGFAKNLFDAATGADNAKFSIDEMALSLKKAFKTTKLFATGLTLIAQNSKLLTKQMDRLSVSFNRNTGALKMYGSQIDFLEGNMRTALITGEDVFDTYSGLINNFRQFNTLTIGQQQEIAKNTAILNELGVGADITAQNYNHLVSALGMTTEEASRQQREMFVLAQTIGMPPREMAEGLSSTLPQLMMYGSKSTDMYKKIAVNARAARMSIDSIISATDQFDRFDTAAESVGKMNAYLGGPFLSATKMIAETDRVERMRMLADATRDAGLSFEDMGYHMRRNLASAMGLKDIGELALVMSNNFDAVVPKSDESAASIEALAMQTAEFNETMDVLKSTLKMFIISLRPALEGIKSLVGGFNGLIAANSELRLGIGLTVSAILMYIAVSAQSIPVFGQILGAILAIVAGMITIASYVGSIRDVFTAFKDGSSGAVGTLGKLLLTFVLLLNPVGQILLILMNLGDILSYIGSLIKTALEPAIAMMSYIFGSLGAEIERINKVIGPPLMAFFTMMYDLFVALSPLLKAVGFLISVGVLAPLIFTFGVLKGFLNIVAVIFEYLAEHGAPVTKIFKDMSSGIKKLSDGAKDLGRYIISLLKPLREWAHWLGWIGDGLAAVVHSIFIGNSPSVKKAMEFLKTAISPVTSVVEALAEAFRMVVSEMKEMATMDFTETADNIGQATARMAYYMSPIGLGIEAGRYATQRISGANSDKAASNAVQNQQLNQAVNKLSDKVDKMGDINIEVNNSADKDKIINSTVKRVNREAQRKVSYSN